MSFIYPSLNVLENNSESIFHPKLRQWYLSTITRHKEQCLTFCLCLLDSLLRSNIVPQNQGKTLPFKTLNSTKDLKKDYDYYALFRFMMVWKTHTRVEEKAKINSMSIINFLKYITIMQIFHLHNNLTTYKLCLYKLMLPKNFVNYSSSFSPST